MSLVSRRLSLSSYLLGTVWPSAAVLETRGPRPHPERWGPSLQFKEIPGDLPAHASLGNSRLMAQVIARAEEAGPAGNAAFRRETPLGELWKKSVSESHANTGSVGCPAVLGCCLCITFCAKLLFLPLIHRKHEFESGKARKKEGVVGEITSSPEFSLDHPLG